MRCSALLGFAAAAVWFVAAIVRLPIPPTKQFTGASNVGIPLLVKKLQLQGWLNALAALLTAAAVALQAAGY